MAPIRIDLMKSLPFGNDAIFVDVKTVDHY